jgi:hypothetical protein
VLPRRTFTVDAGPLKAAIDRGDVDHAWAVRAFLAVPARFITCEAAIAEAQHVLARNYERTFVLATDFRYFSAYRVPFASPKGAFYIR